MNKLNRQRLTLLFIGLTFLSGCAVIPVPFTGTTNQILERHEERDKSYYSPKKISHTEIEISSSGRAELQDEIRDVKDYLVFQQRYNPIVERIINALKQKRLKEIEIEIKSLAARLEQDRSPYAQKQLIRVKNFSYVVYEVSEITRKTSERKLDPVIGPTAVGVTSFYAGVILPIDIIRLPFQAIDKLQGQEAGKFLEATRSLYKEWGVGEAIAPKKTSEKFEGYSFNKIQVWPYKGEREIIEKNIPYKRLKQEITKERSVK